MAIAHLIAGPQGAGKTTRAIELARSQQAIRFSIDDWMVQLFGADLPAQPSLDWIMQRVARCEAQIWATALSLLDLNQTVVLDLGFMQQAQRQTTTQRLIEAGHTPQWQLLHADTTTRKARVLKRNETRGESYALTVSEAMFDFMETRYEAPDAAELTSI